MALFSRNKGSKNWQSLSKKGFQDQAKNRDVHSTQNLDRGEMGEVSKPIKEHILSVFLAILFAVLGYIAGYIFFFLGAIYQYIATSNGGSFLGFSMADVQVSSDWRIWAWTALVFVISWLAFNQKLMLSHKSRNSMVDATDINTYENDQRIMLPEEIQREYDYFPDTGAHSSVQVSSMLSHFMLSKKGLKPVEVVERFAKDVVDDEGGVIHYKGEVAYDDNGLPIKTRMPMIDEEFGQELFTASGIPPSEKQIRKPVEVKGIEYNPKDDTGNRKDRDKLEYDGVADLINNDWEFPEYEVQRPAGAYIVDTAPVNTMVLAITRAGKGKLARSV